MADFTQALEQLRGAYELGAEGSAVTPTRILATGPAGNIDASDVRKRETIEDRRAAGTRTSLRGTYSGIEMSTLRLSSIPVSYNEIHWYLGLIAPSGAGLPGTVDTSAYTRTFTPVEGTALATYGTGWYSAYLEYSSLDFSGTLVNKMPSMRISSMTFNWNKRASGTDTGVTMDLELQMAKGTASSGTAFTGSLTAGTPTLAIGNQLTAYIDAASTALGTTTDNQITSASFTIVNPLTWHDGMDGTNGHTSAHYAQQWTPTMTITRRFSDLTEYNAYVARTERDIRIQAVGGTVGASTATNIFRFDMVAKPMDHRWTAIDGLYYAEIDFEGIYDSTLTTSWRAFVQNGVAAAATAT